MKRIVFLSDIHAGHRLGLRREDGYPWWEYFRSEIDDLKPIDICVVNGDAIEDGIFYYEKILTYYRAVSISRSNWDKVIKIK